MTANQEKLHVGNVLDGIFQRKYDSEGFAILANAKFGTLKYFKEKLWLALSVLETGMISAERAIDFKTSRVVEFDPLLVKKTFEVIQAMKVPPHYPAGTQQLRNASHTLREAAIRGATKTLTTALTIAPSEPEVLARIAQIVTSVRQVSDNKLIGAFDVLLHFGADLSLRNHAVLKNIDAELGGQSLLFRSEIEESELLSLVDKKYYPFFTMLARHNVSYITPLTLKYHLLVTEQTPFDFLIVCKEEERPITLLLMGA